MSAVQVQQAHPALAGRTLRYLWNETSGLLQPGSFNATRPDLRIEVRPGCAMGGAGRRGGTRRPPRPIYTNALHPPASLQALRGVDAGATLRFTFTATLEGTDARSTSTTLELTALASPVEAKLQGPRGDVLDTRELVFSGESSLDPDDRAGRTPFRYQWSCTAIDAATQVGSSEG